MVKKAITLMGLCVILCVSGNMGYAQAGYPFQAYPKNDRLPRAAVQKDELLLIKEEESTRLYQQVQQEMYDEARGMYDENYAGSYLDGEKNLIIQFVGAENIPEPIKNMANRNVNVVLKEADYPYNQLNSIYETISNGMGKATPAAEYGNVMGVEVSIQENRVIVSLKDCSEEKIQHFREKISSHPCIRYKKGGMAAVGSQELVNTEAEETISKGCLEYKITSGAEGSLQVMVVGADVKRRKVSIPAFIKINGLKYPVTAIGENAFSNHKNLEEIVIGKNISQIGKRAFYNCRNLTKVHVKTNSLGKAGIGNRAFYKAGGGNGKELKVQVPAGKRELSRKIQKQAGS